MKHILLGASVLAMLSTGAYAQSTQNHSFNGLASRQTLDTDGNVDMNGAAVSLSGRIGGDVDMNGAAIDLHGEVGGNVYANGGAIEVDAIVAGETEVNGGAITLEGQFDGPTHINGGAIDLQGIFNQGFSANFGALDFTGSAYGPVELSGKGRRGIFRRADRSKVRIGGNLAEGGAICAHEVEFRANTSIGAELVILADSEPDYPDSLNTELVRYQARDSQRCDDI